MACLHASDGEVTRFESDVRPTQVADIQPPMARRCLAEIALALPDGRQRETRAIRGPFSLVLSI
jgi:hypothetical protein